MILLVVRHLVLPHAENDFQPFGAQSPDRLVVAMPSGATLLIIMLRPLTVSQRLKGYPPNSLPQMLVAGDTKSHDATFPTLAREGHRARLGLQVVPRDPATWGITQFRPQAGNHRATEASRQRLHPLSCWEGHKKTFNLRLVLRHGPVGHQDRE